MRVLNRGRPPIHDSDLSQRFQSHQLRRDPSHFRARPSAMRIPPTDRLPRKTTLSFRPKRSSSLAVLFNKIGPELRISSRRCFAAMPRWRSRSHLGGLSSGVSMSAILIFVPRSQKVSPSTTQLILCPLPQIEICSFTFSGCWANPAFEKPKNIMMAMVATVGDALNLCSPQCP